MATRVFLANVTRSRRVPATGCVVTAVANGAV